jgi:hypothetical protein
MCRSYYLSAAILCTAITSCGRGSSDESAALVPNPQDTGAVTEVRPVYGLAASLVGEWELARIPPQPMPGINITVTIDSAKDVRYYGRISHYFSGNVGQDPNHYAQFTDSILHDRSLIFSMPAVESGMPGLAMEGTLTTDTIMLDTFVLGPDTIRSSQHRWILVRRRSRDY